MVIFFLKKDFIWDKNTSISLKFKKVRLLVLFSILFPDRVFSQGPIYIFILKSLDKYW